MVKYSKELVKYMHGQFGEYRKVETYTDSSGKIKYGYFHRNTEVYDAWNNGALKFMRKAEPHIITAMSLYNMGALSYIQYKRQIGAWNQGSENINYDVIEQETINKTVGGKITGYTRHGLNQAIGRDGGKGVSPKAILDAVRNPKEVIIQPGGKLGDTTKYIGQNATVVLNDSGKVVTTWANNSIGTR